MFSVYVLLRRVLVYVPYWPENPIPMGATAEREWGNGEIVIVFFFPLSNSGTV